MVGKVDAIVVGLGIVGSSIFEALSRNGNYNVIGIDRYRPPHAFGSSGGETRIHRDTPGEGAPYDKLAPRSFRNIVAFEKRTGLSYYKRDIYGGFDAATQLSPRAIACHRKLWTDTVAEICEARHASDEEFRFQLYLGAEFKHQFPMHNLPDSAFVVWQNRVLVLAMERLWNSYLAVGRQNGGRACFNAPVERLDLGRGNAVILEDGTRFVADHIFCTAGPWMKSLLGDHIEISLTPERRVTAECEVTKVTGGGLLPGCFVTEEDGEPEVYYWVPSLDGRRVKVAKNSHLREPLDPSLPNPPPNIRDIELIRQVAGRYLNGVRFDPASARSCIYTMTPDEIALIDDLPGYGGVHVFSPDNGTGAKYAGVYGDIALSMMDDSDYNIDLSRFSFAAHREAARLRRQTALALTAAPQHVPG